VHHDPQVRKNSNLDERRSGVPADTVAKDTREAPMRAITGFHQDDEGHWVAQLACGHSQHMRHQPPWQVRPWVVTEEGRGRMVGTAVPCRPCGLAVRDGSPGR
jgi:hypothetical protein